MKAPYMRITDEDKFNILRKFSTFKKVGEAQKALGISRKNMRDWKQKFGIANVMRLENVEVAYQLHLKRIENEKKLEEERVKKMAKDAEALGPITFSSIEIELLKQIKRVIPQQKCVKKLIETYKMMQDIEKEQKESSKEQKDIFKEVAENLSNTIKLSDYA